MTSCEDSAPCPACGGRVKDFGATGVCESCGLELKAVEQKMPEPALNSLYCPKCSAANELDAEFCDQCSTPLSSPSAAKSRDQLSRELSVAISTRIQLGKTVDAAVAESLALFDFSAAQAPSSPSTQPEPRPSRLCVLCRATMTADVCSSCGLSENAKIDVACPRCGETVWAGSGKCGCGAILTLSALAETFDDSAAYVCKRCKTLYVSSRPSCADCQGDLVSSSHLRAHASKQL